MSKKLIRGSLLATTVIAGMSFATSAFAQDVTPPTNVQGTVPPAPADDATPEAGVQSSESAAPAEETSQADIVVTGTLIRNPNLVASAPVTVVGQEEIQLKQSNVAEEAAARRSRASSRRSAATSTTATAARPSSTFAASATTVTSSCSTATRIVPSDIVGRVDFNNIPLALVERIDVLTGGASTRPTAPTRWAAWSTSSPAAISPGVELTGSEQITERGDGNVFRADLTSSAPISTTAAATRCSASATRKPIRSTSAAIVRFSARSRSNS